MDEGISLPRASGSGGRNSGSAKLKSRNSLPQVFIIASTGSPCSVLGAFVVSGAYQCSDGHCYVTSSGTCLLEDPIPVSRSVCTQSNGLFRIVPSMETLIRQAPAAVGMSLNANFIAFAALSWRAWPFANRDLEAFRQPHPPTHLAVKASMFKAMGVQPVLIATLQDVLPQCDDVIAGALGPSTSS